MQVYPNATTPHHRREHVAFLDYMHTSSECQVALALSMTCHMTGLYCIRMRMAKSSESPQRPPRRQRHRRQVVLRGEVQLEQHLRDSEHFGSACQMAKSLCLMPCTGESSESSQRRPRRQRRRRQVVLPGEIQREQHLRDPKRRRADSRGQCSASAGIDDVATGLDDLAQASAEDWSDPAELLSEAPQVCCTCLVSYRILLGRSSFRPCPRPLIC